MLRLTAFLTLLLLAGAPVRAELVTDLYRGDAIVTGQDNLDERDRGLRLALTRVLVKVGGDDRIVDHPMLPPMLSDAHAHVRHVEYEDRKKGIQVSDEQGTRDRSFHLRADFDPAGVNGILERLGVRPWHPDRPRLLVMLAVTDHTGPFVVGTDTGRGIGQRETLLIDAHRRGVPLVLPKMDAVETVAVGYREVAATSGVAIGALASAYAADAVLAGAITITADGSWNTDWTLLADDMPERWTDRDVTFDRSIATALGRAARILAAGLRIQVNAL